MGLEAAELARWTRFAAKGGIGKCIATCDCVAESADDLMFLQGDEITVLLQLQDREGYFLGYCEGVVGRFAGADVQFSGKLKKPVMAKRVSSTSSSSIPHNTAPPSPAFGGVSPSPTPANPQTQQHRQSPSAASYTPIAKRASSTPSPVSAAAALRAVSTSSAHPQNSSTTQRTRTASFEHRTSYSTSQRYHASPLSGSNSLLSETAEDNNVGARSWHPDDEDAQGTAFATLHELALSEAGESHDSQRWQNKRYAALAGAAFTSSPLATPSPHEGHFSAAISGDGQASRAGSRSGSVGTASPPPSRVNSPPHASAHTRPFGPSSAVPSPAGTPPTSPPPSQVPALRSTPPTSPSSTNTSFSQPSSPRAGQPAFQPHRYTTNAPSPLTLHRDLSVSAGNAKVTPLRITKRSPGPGAGFSLGSGTPPEPRSPPPTGALPVVPASPPGGGRVPIGAAGYVPRIGGEEQAAQSPGPDQQTLVLPPRPLTGLSPTLSSASAYSVPSPPLSPPSPAQTSAASVVPVPAPVHPVVVEPTPQPQLGERAHVASPPPPSASTVLLPAPTSPPPAPVTATDVVAPTPEPSPAPAQPSVLQAFAARLGWGSSAPSTSPNPTPAPENTPATHAADAKVKPANVEDTQSQSTTAVKAEKKEEVTSAKIGLTAPIPITQQADESPDAARARAQSQSASAAEGVSIGLSLLEGLIGSYSDSDSGSEYDDDERDATVAKTNRYSVAESDDSTAEGLGYARSEEDHTQVAPPPPAVHLPIPTQQGDTRAHAQARSPEQAHVQQPQQNERFLSPPTSPTGHTFPDPPTLAFSQSPGARSSVHSATGSGAGTRSVRSVRSDTLSSWEGDIYDNYRYSRAEGSVRSGGTAAESVRSFGGFTPAGMGERRPSFDSVRSGGWRERVDSGAGRRLDGFVEEDEDVPPVTPVRPPSEERREEIPAEPVTTLEAAPLHRRTSSVDSDASVYTQNSRLSTLSRDLAIGGVLANLGATETEQGAVSEHTDRVTDDETKPGRGSKPPSRRPTLNLATDSEPLLHTSWGSAVSSPGMSTAGLGAFTPIAGVLTNEGRGGFVLADTGARSAYVEPPLKSPNTMAGFASQMRMRLEEDRAGGVQEEEDQKNQSQSFDRGIVVEDDEELPSRVENTTFDSQADTEDASYMSHTSGTSARTLLAQGGRSPDSSPEPEILGRLAPLIVANRTPSPEAGQSTSVLPAQPPLPPTSSDPPDSLAPSLSPPPSQGPSPSPSPSHLRPSLAELRAPGGAPLPGTNQRRSLFLPHPNAPKAPQGLVSPGPMYIAAQQANTPAPGGQPGIGPTLQPGQFAAPGQMQQQQQRAMNAPPRPNVFAAIHMALSLAARPPPPGAPIRAPPRGPTIYGRTETDLAAAYGPVPIAFGVEPPRATAPPPGAPNVAHVPPPKQTKGPQAGAPPTSPPRVQMMVKGGGAPPRSKSLGPGSVTAGSRLNPNADATPLPSVQATLGVPPAPAAGQAATPGPIPRANFFPKAAGLRPRSRSFSGFNTGAPAVRVPQRSREDAELGPRKGAVASATPQRALSASVSPAPSSTSGTSITSSTSLSISPSSSLTSNATAANSPTSPKSSSAPTRPSPLALSSQLRSSAPVSKPSIASPAFKPPSSPLAQSVFTGPASRDDVPETRSSAGAISSGSPVVQPAAGDQSGGVNTRPTPQRRAATLDEGPNIKSSDGAGGRTASLLGVSKTNGPELKGTHSMMDLKSHAVAESRTSTSSDRDARVQLAMSPPPTMGRQLSLRSKLSLPNLRRKQSKVDDELPSPIGNEPNSGGSMPHSTSPLASAMHDPEMLQVADMEFELVRPNLGRAYRFEQAARTSEDSNVLGREGSLDIRQDRVESSTLLRAESPAFSVASSTLPQDTGGGAGWTPQTSNNSISLVPPPAPQVIGEQSMEAHRSRELKWMSLMATNPAAQARKSKKVRKLLIEGVPSSVRYLVWTYLTDGKARAVPGVYAQLSARGRPAVASRIEEDVRVGFVGEDHLQGTKGGVLSLLSAYLNMVPDVQYSMGLTLVVGQLLLLAPEEDAFWIFVSIMDTHIRPYFASTTTQMDVDAALFSRALENNDPQTMKKIFVDLGISPTTLCAPWFSSLFVGTLPLEHLYRVWDLFLFEGVPFLLRVAIVIVQCCRRVIIESTSDSVVLKLLRHPPSTLLPPTADAFLALVFSVKLKDDDMRKQRIKMEAQVKRQTQVPRTVSTSGVGMISLPRA